VIGSPCSRARSRCGNGQGGGSACGICRFAHGWRGPRLPLLVSEGPASQRSSMHCGSPATALHTSRQGAQSLVCLRTIAGVPFPQATSFRHHKVCRLGRHTGLPPQTPPTPAATPNSQRDHAPEGNSSVRRARRWHTAADPGRFTSSTSLCRLVRAPPLQRHTQPQHISSRLRGHAFAPHLSHIPKRFAGFSRT
jgi:hypothetical protein